MMIAWIILVSSLEAHNWKTFILIQFNYCGCTLTHAKPSDTHTQTQKLHKLEHRVADLIELFNVFREGVANKCSLAYTNRTSQKNTQMTGRDNNVERKLHQGKMHCVMWYKCTICRKACARHCPPCNSNAHFVGFASPCVGTSSTISFHYNCFPTTSIPLCVLCCVWRLPELAGLGNVVFWPGFFVCCLTRLLLSLFRGPSCASVHALCAVLLARIRCSGG